MQRQLHSSGGAAGAAAAAGGGGTPGLSAAGDTIHTILACNGGPYIGYQASFPTLYCCIMEA